jgi:hypothetical protein
MLHVIVESQSCSDDEQRRAWRNVARLLIGFDRRRHATGEALPARREGEEECERPGAEASTRPTAGAGQSQIASGGGEPSGREERTGSTGV